MTTNPAEHAGNTPDPSASLAQRPTPQSLAAQEIGATEKNYLNALASALLSSLLAAAIAWIIAFIAFGFMSDDVSTSKWPMACALLAASGAYIVKWFVLKSAKRI